MQACWNKLSLDRPPTTSWQCSANEFNSKGFLKIIDKALLELQSNMAFQTEAAIISRLIYRMKSKLRSDKGLKNMEKVNRALLNYLKLSLENDYTYLKDNAECNGSILALPSRQMLQYVLVRTQGFSKLMCRIESVAGHAADFFKSRLSLGQAWNMSIVAYAVISRIWLLSRYLAKRCCEWYNRLHEYVNKLKLVGIEWLPEKYSLPGNLKTWLSVSWINDDPKNVPSKDGLTDSIFKLITQSQDVDDYRDPDLVQKTHPYRVSSALPVVQSDEISVSVEKSNKMKKSLEESINRIPVSLDEVGERISRDTFVAGSSKGSSKTQTTKRKLIDAENKDDVVGICVKRGTKLERKQARKSKAMDVDEIETKEDVLRFISSETYPGLDKLQWKIMRKNVKKLLMKLNKFEGGSNTKKQDILLKKVIQSIREWIN